MADDSEPRGDARDPRRDRAADRPAGRAGDGARRPYAKSDGPKRPYVKRDGDKPYAKRDGEKRPYVKRDGEKRPYVKRDGEKPYAKRDGEKRPFVKRDGDKPYAKRDGEKRPYVKRDGDKPYAKRDGEKRLFDRRDGDKPYAKRDGDRPYARREVDRPRGDRPFEKRGPRGAGGADIRADRPRHDDPPLPETVTARDLNGAARNQLKTLSKENAEEVARHLAMAAEHIHDDPALAHRHALAAERRAGRIAVVRETAAITAYAIGDFALALRELRTYRRISGSDDQIALLVDSERGVGRPDRALEAGRAVDRASLPTDVRVELAIAMSGARLDLDQPDRALLELDIPELDPDRAFEWSPGLFAARATVLEVLGRDDEATVWRRRAQVAAEVLDEASGFGEDDVIEVDDFQPDELQIVEEPAAEDDVVDVESADDTDHAESSDGDGGRADESAAEESAPDEA